MKDWTKRLIALGLITAALLAGVALSGRDEALAAPCCSWCDNGWDTCYIGCNGSPSCEAGCDTRWANCFRNCISSC